MKQINLLEGSLGIQLFNRTPRRLTLRSCAALELMRVPICCAVSIYHPLAKKN